MFKRIMSLILCVVMLVTALPLEAMAQQGESTGTLDPGMTEVRGTNTFGTMVAEEIQAEYEEEANAYGGYGILDLEITGNTAKVNYFALEEANLVVAIYTEDGVQMLTSGNTRVDPEKTVATVTIAGTMPQYFMVGAYMLDTYDFSPLCSQYSSALYTKEIQELVNSTVEDYDPELVLNLDDDNTTNFAVYAEDTIVVDEQEGVNTLVKADETNKVYVIENADEQFLYLQQGDVISYPQGENDLLIIKVASASVSGTTVTIQGGELEMEDVFSHVKIEGTNDIGDATVDTSTGGDMVDFLGHGSAEASGSSPMAWEGDYGVKDTLKFKLKESLCKKYGLDEASFALSLGVQLDFYLTAKTQSISLSAYFDTEFTVKVAAKIKTPAIVLGTFYCPIVPGVDMILMPDLHFEIGGEIELKFTHRIIASLSYTNDTGISLDTSSDIVKSDIEISVVIAAVVNFDPLICVLGECADIGLILEAKIELKGTLYKMGLDIPKTESGFAKWSHACQWCVDMELSFEVKYGVTLGLLWGVVEEELTRTFDRFPTLYFHLNDGGFGGGKCRNIAYLTTFVLTNQNGKPAKGVWVSSSGHNASGSSNSEGIAHTYVKVGEQTLNVKYPSGTTYTKKVDISDCHTFKVKEGSGFAKTGLWGQFQALIDTVKNFLKQLAEFADKVLTEVVQATKDQEGSGRVSDTVRYIMYKNGKLEVFGQGYIPEFDNPYKSKVTELVIGDGITAIGSSVFKGYTKLEKVTLPDSVTMIGTSAFQNCSSLTNIKFPASVTEISDRAFAQCTSLTSIRLPEKLTVIEDEVFYGCTALSSVEIPSSVTRIDMDAFNKTGLTSVKLPGKLTSIDSCAFANCTKLTAFTIPDSCTELGLNILSGCSGLKRLVIGSGIEIIDDDYLGGGFSRLEELEIRGGKTIGEHTFENCKRLKTVKLADSIETIELQAFASSGLKTITLPKNLKTVGASAFAWNTNLTEIELPVGLEIIEDYAFSDCDSLERIVIPEGVVEMKSCVFYDCDKLAYVSLPDSLTVLPYQIFTQCYNLKEVKLPSKLTTIEKWAFLNCSSLTEVTLPDTLTTLEEGVFCNCTALQRLEIPAGVDVIPTELCQGCTSLKEVVIHGGKSVGQSAFAYLEQLETVTLADSITEIGDWAFFGCIRIETLDLPENLQIIGDYALSNCTSLSKMEFPAGLKHIGYNAVVGNALTEVRLPEGLETLGGRAFQASNVLKELYIPSTLGVIPYQAFMGAVYLEKLTIEDGPTQIGQEAFRGCGMTTVDLPDSVTTIGISAFEQCTTLTSVKLPSNLTTLESRAFADCYRLASVELPDTLTEIPEEAFKNCVEIQKLRIPETVTSIGSNAFQYAPLSEVLFEDDAPAFGETPFGSPGEDCVAFYPAGNETWTEEIMASTGILTWKAYTLDENGEIVIDESRTEETEPEATEEFYAEATEAQEEIPETTAAETVPETIEETEAAEVTEPEEMVAAIEETAATILAVILRPFTLRARAAETEPLAETESAVTEAAETVPATETITESLPAETIAETFPAEEDDSLQVDAPAHDAVFGGEYSTEEGITYTMITATFRDLVPGEQYVLLDVLDIEAENPLSAGNLLSINQGVADSKGVLVFQYAQRVECDTSSIIACGASNRNLKDAFIRFPTMLENESFENINPTVDYYGSILTEGYDYVLLGDVTYTEAGTYTCFIRGINQYTGLVECQYTVVPDTLPTISIAGNNLLTSGESTQLEARFLPEALPGTKVTWSLAEGDEAYARLEPDWGYFATVTALETAEERTVTVIASAPEDAHAGQLQIHIAAAPLEKLTICREDYDDEGYLVYIPLSGEQRFGYSAEKDTLTLAALGTPGDKKINVTWESSDESIAQIDSQLGIARFTGTHGPVTFTARYNDDFRAEVTYLVGEYVPETTEPEEPTEPGELPDPSLEQFALSQRYIALQTGWTYTLRPQISSPELVSQIQWSVDDGTIVDVDGSGLLTAKNTGTAYVTATVTQGEITFTDRCRVDVYEELGIKGIQLSASKLSSELYSANYTELEVLLKLPQNYAALSETGDSQIPMCLGVAIESARFENDAMAQLFDLIPLDDRRLAVVPTNYAIHNPKEVKGSYSGRVAVMAGGQEYTSETITLTVKKSAPKLKATVAAFNSFYSGQTQQIQITGGTVTAIRAEMLPNWLLLQDGSLTLTEDAPTKNASAKVSLMVETEEWRIPAAVTLNVKNTYKAPGLKLSASSVTMAANASDSIGVKLQLLPKNKKDTLSSMDVTNITAPAGYAVENFNAQDGSFVLKAAEGFVPGKIHLAVSFGNTSVQTMLPLTVKTSGVKLKLSKSAITLNKAVHDSAAVDLLVTPEDYRIDMPTLRLMDAQGKLDKTGELDIRYEQGQLIVGAKETTPGNASYKLYIGAGGSKEVVLTVKIAEQTPSVSFKAKGNLDLSFPEQSLVVTPAFKHYNGSFTIAEGEYGPFRVSQEEQSVWICCGEEAAVGNHSLTLTLNLDDGSIVENTVKVNVKRTALKLKLGTAKLTLNKQIGDKASVTVTSATKGYTLGTPVLELMDKSGKNSAEGKLAIAWVDGRLQVATNDATEYGATYKLLVKADKEAPAQTLTIAVLAENKSTVTATVKAKGNIDVIRDGSSITVTPSYKNLSAETQKDEILVFSQKVGKQDVEISGLFCYAENGDGTFTVTKAAGAKLDHSGKYTVKLVTSIDGKEICQSKPVNLSVKMGSAKLTLTAQDTVLFAKDIHDRVEFSIGGMDAALNSVSGLEIKDAKYQNLLEIDSYGNGEFAVGFKDGHVDKSLIGKTITVNLNVFLDGNETVKANATMKLKISIIP